MQINKQDEKIALEYLSHCTEAFKFIGKDGRIDIGAILTEIDMLNNKKILQQHPYAIVQMSSGRWQTYLPDENKKRIQIRRVNKKDVERCVIEHYKKKIAFHSVHDVMYEWLGQKKKEPGFTNASYDRYENLYKKFFGNIENYDVSKFTKASLEDCLIESIIDNQITRKGWGNYKIIIRGIFKYAKRHEYTDIMINDVLDYIDSEKKIFTIPRVKTNEDDVFTDEEVTKIEEYIDTRDNISLVDLGIKLALKTGLRAGELASLKYSDLNAEEKYINISRTEQHSKNAEGHIEYYFSDEGVLKCGHKAEKLYLSNNAIALIEKIHNMNPENDFLFYTNHYIRSQAFTKRLNCICSYINIKPRSLHKARKTYATRLINAGVDKALVQSQLRHSDITTTLKYYYRDNLSSKNKADIIEKAMGQY